MSNQITHGHTSNVHTHYLLCHSEYAIWFNAERTRWRLPITPEIRRIKSVKLLNMAISHTRLQLQNDVLVWNYEGTEYSATFTGVYNATELALAVRDQLVIVTGVPAFSVTFNVNTLRYLFEIDPATMPFSIDTDKSSRGILEMLGFFANEGLKESTLDVIHMLTSDKIININQNSHILCRFENDVASPLFQVNNGTWYTIGLQVSSSLPAIELFSTATNKDSILLYKNAPRLDFLEVSFFDIYGQALPVTSPFNFTFEIEYYV